MSRQPKQRAHAVAPESAVCAAFATQPSAYPQKPKSRTLRHRAGVLRERQAQKKDACGRISAEAEAASGEAGQSRGVVRAPQRSHLPAVRAVSGIYEGVPKAAKNSRRALQNEKSPPFQGKQRGSNEKHEGNTEKW